MKVLYTRVSSLDQSTERQKVSGKGALLVEDKCSGAIPFFEREGGKKIRKLVNKGTVTSIQVKSIDRFGRDLKDILLTIEFFNERKIPIFFESQGLKTIDDNGRENYVSKMMISILGVVAEMERNQIRERQMEGIMVAKAKGNVYKGRKPGAIEDPLKFLTKPKNAKAAELLKKGVAAVDIVKHQDVKLSLNTITKIKKRLKELRRV